MGVAHTLAEAWSTEAKERGATPSTPGYDDAQNLFYSGAAAMLAMFAETRNHETALNLALTIQAELREYLEVVDAADAS